MSIKGLSEVIVYVEDMAKMIRFYRDILGLKTTVPLDDQELDNLYWVTFETGECTLALHGGGNGNKGIDAPKFVFRVDDVSTVREILISRNVDMGGIRSLEAGIQVCDGKDQEGNAFSIESHADAT